MTRPLTPAEKTQMGTYFPRMDLNKVEVSGEATKVYNCLAWTFGITTSWVWPWSSKDVTKKQFDVLYKDHGFDPIGSGSVAVFGVSSDSMQHGSLTGPGHGSRWESKLGEWLRIQHGLGEMEGGTTYGNVLGYYEKHLEQPFAKRAIEMQTKSKLTEAEIQFTKDQASRVDRKLGDRFETAYGVWRSTWADPLMVVSSNPADRARSLEFLRLVSLGPQILPLLMEKLTDPEEFFALQAVEQLIRSDLVVRYEPGDEAILGGEQQRAAETVRRWIRFEK